MQDLKNKQFSRVGKVCNNGDGTDNNAIKATDVQRDFILFFRFDKIGCIKLRVGDWLGIVCLQIDSRAGDIMNEKSE